MEEYKRKLQIVAGSTYSLSLPKDWIRKMNIVPKQELILREQDDGNLIISPKNLKAVDEKIVLSLDEYFENLDQILISLYYYGYSFIGLVSSKEILSEQRNLVRKVLVNLSGADIIHEDKKLIEIKIVFDSDRLDIFQLFYRMNLIIGESLENICLKFNISEIKLNEDEVDRLYNFLIKIIQTSLEDRSVLISSKIGNLKIIPSLFLISKKMENLADSIEKIAFFMEKEGVNLKLAEKILFFVKEELNRSILYLMGKQKKVFVKFSIEEKKEYLDKINKINLDQIKLYLERIFRDLGDIQDEIISIGFYKKILSK